MRLASAVVGQVLTQFNAQALPEDHPAVPNLSRIFGEHTFFLDKTGLKIVEPTGTEVDGTIVARVVKIASWRDASMTEMKRHDPEPTEVVVTFDTDGSNKLH
jgi:hypothetical protein